MFKIIAIELLKPTKLDVDKDKPLSDLSQTEIDTLAKLGQRSSVNRVLGQETYYFIQGYTVADGRVTKKASCLSDDFFNQKTDYSPSISISAVVGANGSGKSTLLVYLVRLMNNLAARCNDCIKGYGKSDLQYVKEVYGRLYLEIDDTYYSIEQFGDRMIVYKQKGNDCKQIELDEKKDPDKHKEILSELFYTIVVDYSSFSWNINDYYPEWVDMQEENADDNDRCWIGKLFHKNDSYQTPIVLNPFRQEGNINFNNERDLLKDRLLLLILQMENNIDKLLLNKQAHSLQIDTKMEYTPAGRDIFTSVRLMRKFWEVEMVTSIKENTLATNCMTLCQNILKCWGEVYSANLVELMDKRNNKDVCRALNYVVYKTIKIAQTYSQYRRYSDFKNHYDDKNWLTDYIKELYRRKTHITLKLRRAIAFLVLKHYDTSKKEYQTITIGRLKEKFAYLSSQPGHWDMEELLPPPSFRTDLLMTAEGKEDNLLYSSLSSGEKQIINAVCTVVYHLHNLESGFNDTSRISYKYVNVIFDELELYFHPKYQTMLVNRLIESIDGMKLQHIKGINIMLSTHSPFILSDIPHVNSLRIDQGSPAKDSENTFCSNVYDILNNHFFMDEFVGDFAKKKIQTLFDSFKEGVKSIEEYTRIYNEIDLIGDEVIREVMHRKLNESTTGRAGRKIEIEQIKKVLQQKEAELEDFT